MSEDNKCACENCHCSVKEGEQYCGEACANKHPNNEPCGHEGCQCHEG